MSGLRLARDRDEDVAHDVGDSVDVSLSVVVVVVRLCSSAVCNVFLYGSFRVIVNTGPATDTAAEVCFWDAISSNRVMCRMGDLQNMLCPRVGCGCRRRWPMVISLMYAIFCVSLFYCVCIITGEG